MEASELQTDSSYGDVESQVEFIFLRHAQAPFSRTGDAPNDPPLSALAVQQAEAAGKLLRDESVTDVLVSTLLRAQQTFDALRLPHGTTCLHEDWLAEIRYPEWVGVPHEEIVAKLGAVRRLPLAERWSTYAPEGESTRAYIKRILEGFTQHIELQYGMVRTGDTEPTFFYNGGPRRILIVGHAGSIPCAAGVLLGLQPSPWPWELMRLAHASVTRLSSIDLGDRISFGLNCLSNTAHLESAAITS